MENKTTKTFRLVSQIVIGVIFIFSGFVKAVDPIGGAIQLTDYLNAFSLGFLTPAALFMSIALAAVEFLIGIHILLGIRLKITTWPMVLMMVFFTLLTFYSALANPVSDCGCFGDAIKLTNWETFFKNLILLPFALYLFTIRNKHDDGLSLVKVGIQKICFTIFILGISIYALKYEPIIDFRPFKIGVNITQSMSIPPDAEKPVYKTTFILEKDGKKAEFDEVNYPYTDSTWVFIDQKSTLIKEGYTPPIHDFMLLTENGDDHTQLILNENAPLFLLIAPKIDKINTANFEKFVQLSLTQAEWGHQFHIVTSSVPADIKKFESQQGIGFSYLVADETTLKTMMRSNPGLMLLQNGTVIGKWNAEEITNAEQFKNPVSAAISQSAGQKNKIIIALSIAIMALITMAFYKHK